MVFSSIANCSIVIYKYLAYLHFQGRKHLNFENWFCPNAWQPNCAPLWFLGCSAFERFCCDVASARSWMHDLAAHRAACWSLCACKFSVAMRWNVICMQENLLCIEISKLKTCKHAFYTCIGSKAQTYMSILYLSIFTRLNMDVCFVFNLYKYKNVCLCF